MWLLTVETSPEQDWYATHVGHDVFTRIKPTEEEIAEKAKIKQSLHPRYGPDALAVAEISQVYSCWLGRTVLLTSWDVGEPRTSGESSGGILAPASGTSNEEVD